MKPHGGIRLIGQLVQLIHVYGFRIDIVLSLHHAVNLQICITDYSLVNIVKRTFSLLQNFRIVSW